MSDNLKDMVRDIRERADKATEGPWEVGGMDSGHSKYEMSWWVTAGEGDTICDMDGLTRAGNDDLAKDDGKDDAQFIAHARTDNPRLVSVVEAMLSLHRPFATVDEGGEPDGMMACEACKDHDDHSGERVHEIWPCYTVREISRALAGEETHEAFRMRTEQSVTELWNRIDGQLESVQG